MSHSSSFRLSQKQVSSTSANQNRQNMEDCVNIAQSNKLMTKGKWFPENQIDSYKKSREEKKENIISPKGQTETEMLVERSEYEMIRERNIERRRNLFQELNFNQVNSLYKLVDEKP